MTRTPDVFAVLSNPVRRRILELLLDRPYTVNDLVDEFRLHRPSISEHLQVLRTAQLVRYERRGRERYYHIEPARLFTVNDWLKPFEHYWRERLHALDRTLELEKETMVQPGTIRLSQFINHPPAKVWQALTDPKIHAKWWAAGDVRAVVGHRFTLDMGPWGQQPCEVIAVEPERLLSYSFAPERSIRPSPGDLSPRTRVLVCTWSTQVSTSILRWEKRPSTAWAKVGQKSWNALRRP